MFRRILPFALAATMLAGVDVVFSQSAEPAPGPFPPEPDQARILRQAEVETARIVSITDAQRDNVGAREIFSFQTVSIPSRLRTEIPKHGQCRTTEEGEPPRPRAPLRKVPRRLESVGLYRDDQERAAREQGDGGEAAARSSSGISNPQSGDGSDLGVRRASAGRPFSSATITQTSGVTSPTSSIHRFTFTPTRLANAW